MAGQLVDGLTGEWDPTKYTNEYRANLLKIIEAKKKNKTPKLQVQEVEADTKVVDLMERLRASLGQAAGTRPAPAGKERAAAGQGRRTTGQKRHTAPASKAKGRRSRRKKVA
jgi:DNA end-binding protein Ku